jgi:hypothetical protein
MEKSREHGGLGVVVDLMQLGLLRHQDRLAEAEQERLAALLPRRRSFVRHAVAAACHRVANWLDSSKPVRAAVAIGTRGLGGSADQRIHLACRIGHPASRSRLQNTSDGPTHIAVIHR